MKFQPGDKVRVVKPERMESPQRCAFVSAMHNYIGRELTIRKWVGRINFGHNMDDPIPSSGTHYKTEETSWTWYEDWLELVQTNFLSDEDLKI